MHDDRTTRVDPDERVIGGVTHESLTPIKDAHRALWDGRAKRLLERALGHWDVDEPHADIGAAQACLRVAEGHLDPFELYGYDFPGEEVERGECICPPELLERGGFKGGCPVHG